MPGKEEAQPAKKTQLSTAKALTRRRHSTGPASEQSSSRVVASRRPKDKGTGLREPGGGHPLGAPPRRCRHGLRYAIACLTAAATQAGSDREPDLTALPLEGADVDAPRDARVPVRAHALEVLLPHEAPRLAQHIVDLVKHLPIVRQGAGGRVEDALAVAEGALTRATDGGVVEVADEILTITVELLVMQYVRITLARSPPGPPVGGWWCTVGHRSANWIVRFVLIVATAASTSFGTAAPRHIMQHATYLQCRGSHFTHLEGGAVTSQGIATPERCSW
mmetsp:Transcript_37545/g.106075  ORF Transcript_37545/g.106075 Transcript_37545/m.106075 type:complete len:278 (+) Transcript_37545:47-880(+)